MESIGNGCVKGKKWEERIRIAFICMLVELLVTAYASTFIGHRVRQNGSRRGDLDDHQSLYEGERYCDAVQHGSDLDFNWPFI